MSVKVILALAALALLFVALVVWGAARDDEDSGGWTFGTLAGCAAGRAVLGSDVVDQRCFSNRVFTARPGRPCVVRIRPLEERFAWRHRQLVLALARGGKVQVQLAPAEANAPAVSLPLSTRMPKGPALPVLPDGGTLTLTCAQPDIASGLCQVRLARR